MSIYKKFCREVLDEQGNLQKFTLHYPENFNFGYDVVDAIAEQTPNKTALVWCNTENEACTFSFGEVREQSNRYANVFHHAGIGRGSCVMLVLKRHYEYWFAAVALRLKNLLEEYGIPEIMESVNGKRRIVPEKVGCDLYDYLTGREEHAQLFKGSYLTNYSWGETTLAELTGEHLYGLGE